MIGNGIKTQLVAAIKSRALEFGDFTLASGQKSTFYLDCRKLTLSADGNYIVAQAMQIAAATFSPYQAIGGPALGADPIVGGMLYHFGITQTEMRGFLIRKEEKAHGKDGLVIGSVKQDDKVLLVEDVGTSGQSLLRACQIIEKYGCHVVGALVIVDRGAGATKLFAKHKIPFGSLLTLADLGL